MRMCAKITIDTERGSAAIKDGSMQQALQMVMDQMKPEASYFFPADGQRCAMLFFEMQDQSDMVPILEPFFMNLDAEVELFPVMNFQDLQSGLSKLQM